MEKHIEVNDTLLLFDNYETDSQSLHRSFQNAGFPYPAMIIEDNGFLPDGVLSAYGFFLGDFKEALGGTARPKYFNQITVPEIIVSVRFMIRIKNGAKSSMRNPRIRGV